jgi:hypothetical protein
MGGPAHRSDLSLVQQEDAFASHLNFANGINGCVRMLQKVRFAAVVVNQLHWRTGLIRTMAKRMGFMLDTNDLVERQDLRTI